MKEINWKKHLLILSKQIIQTLNENPRLVKETGTINAKGDRSIQMDVLLENLVINYIHSNNIPATIFSEEIGYIKSPLKPECLIAFDPLDGSTNYKVGNNYLPYGFLLSVYSKPEPKLKNVLCSLAIEYTTHSMWMYINGKTIDSKNSPCYINNNWIISKSTPVYLDLFYKRGYERYRPLPEQIFIRNTGSTIGNLSYVLLGYASVMGGICMRPEEIGTVYSLIKVAGGKVVDHSGNDLGEKKFDINSTYEIIGGAPKVVDFIQKIIRKT